jgi:hypothetical protein
MSSAFFGSAGLAAWPKTTGAITKPAPAAAVERKKLRLFIPFFIVLAPHWLIG